MGGREVGSVVCGFMYLIHVVVTTAVTFLKAQSLSLSSGSHSVIHSGRQAVRDANHCMRTWKSRTNWRISCASCNRRTSASAAAAPAEPKVVVGAPTELPPAPAVRTWPSTLPSTSSSLATLVGEENSGSVTLGGVRPDQDQDEDEAAHSSLDMSFPCLSPCSCP